MTTYYTFQPTPNQPYTFQPTLDGVQYSATVTWNTYGQRWYITIFTTQGIRILTRPVVGSPDGTDINLVKGYFATSSLVYRDSSNTFEVMP